MDRTHNLATDLPSRFYRLNMNCSEGGKRIEDVKNTPPQRARSEFCLQTVDSRIRINGLSISAERLQHKLLQRRMRSHVRATPSPAKRRLQY